MVGELNSLTIPEVEVGDVEEGVVALVVLTWSAMNVAKLVILRVSAGSVGVGVQEGVAVAAHLDIGGAQVMVEGENQEYIWST